MKSNERAMLAYNACTNAYKDTKDLRFCTEEEIFKSGFEACFSWLFNMPSAQVLDVLDLKNKKDDEELQLLVLEGLLETYGINRSLGNVAENIKDILECKTKTKTH